MTRGRDWEAGELLDLYKVAVDEYRFQVSLNWRRTQYLFALNGAILAVGAGLVNPSQAQHSRLIGVIFALGALISIHAIIVTVKQHGYYKSARDRMREVARIVGIPDECKLTTTPGMARDRKRGIWGRVTRVTVMHNLLFFFLLVVHLTAAAYVFLR